VKANYDFLRIGKGMSGTSVKWAKKSPEWIEEDANSTGI